MDEKLRAAKSRGGVFILQLVYLALLGALAVWFIHRGGHPQKLGSVPTAAPWWGAVGGVMLSMTGVFEHARDWSVDYEFWHWARPFVGAVFATFAVLVFQAGVLAVGQDVKPPAGIATPQNLFYYVVAFVVGYREETARTLLRRAADVIIGPGKEAPRATLSRLLPPKAAAGSPVELSGTGLDKVERVLFGDVESDFVIDSASQITAHAPRGGSGTVAVVLLLKDGRYLSRSFTYE